MKSAWMIGAAAASLAGAAQADELVFDRVVARVQVIPEARSGIAVDVRPGSALAAPSVTRRGDRVVVEGGLETRGCNNDRNTTTVRLRGGGSIDISQAPTITVRVPRSVAIAAQGGAVVGNVGATQDLSINGGGCSAWTIGEVAGTLRTDLSGGASLRGGGARTAVIETSGGASVRLGAVGNLDADASGGGHVTVATVSGGADLDASGGARVGVEGGRTGLLRASASGGAWIDYAGSAEGLEAHASGAAHVRVARVTGSHDRRSSSGGGSITVGR